MSTKADFILAPQLSSLTDAVTNVRLYTATTSSKCDAIPDDWAGKYVRVIPSSGTLTFFFSSDATAACDNAISATDAGASSAELGIPITSGEDFLVPHRPGPSGKIYFVREASASISVHLMVSSR